MKKMKVMRIVGMNVNDMFLQLAEYPSYDINKWKQVVLPRKDFVELVREYLPCEVHEYYEGINNGEHFLDILEWFYCYGNETGRETHIFYLKEKKGKV